MANNFLDESGRDKLFGDIVESMNNDIQEYLKETGLDSVEFSMRGFNFKIHKKEVEG